jgi:hypothetical protein
MRGVDALPMHRRSPVRYQMQRVGTKKVSALFYVSSQLVSGRLTCLIVVPALVIVRVTPLPE